MLSIVRKTETNEIDLGTPTLGFFMLGCMTLLFGWLGIMAIRADHLVWTIAGVIMIGSSLVTGVFFCGTIYDLWKTLLSLLKPKQEIQIITPPQLKLTK